MLQYWKFKICYHFVTGMVPTVAQLDEAPRYIPEGRGFDSR